MIAGLGLKSWVASCCAPFGKFSSPKAEMAMSRVGKQPVVIPGGVKVEVKDGMVRVQGPKGQLELQPHAVIQVEHDDQAKVIKVSRPNDQRLSRSLHGLTRSLINNMVVGVSRGFEKRLKIEGIGYQAQKDKDAVVLIVGYANKVRMNPPTGVTVELPDPTTIVIKGADKQKVGQFAAEIRAVRKPEPYKGKGIRYENEQVRRKEGKSFTSGG